MSGTLTAANAVILLSIPGVFSAPQQLQGFTAEDVFNTAAIEPTETQMGVDGNMSAGFVFVPTPINIVLQADSDSNDMFEAWFTAQRALTDVIYANGTVRLTAISKVYTLRRGVLSSYPNFSDAKKTLQPRTYGTTWQSVTGAPA